MREEREEEILTKERIIKELEGDEKKSIIGFCLLFILFFVFAYIMISVDKYLNQAVQLRTYLLFILPFIQIIFIFISIKNLIVLKSKHCKIISDYAVDKYHTNTWSNAFAKYSSVLRRSHYIIFASHGKYRLPQKTFYEWSEKVQMTDVGVYNCAEKGDEFYIVVVKNRILQIYNKKQFKLKEK